jgi:hypothetical protein
MTRFDKASEALHLAVAYRTAQTGNRQKPMIALMDMGALRLFCAERRTNAELTERIRQMIRTAEAMVGEYA